MLLSDIRIGNAQVINGRGFSPVPMNEHELLIFVPRTKYPILRNVKYEFVNHVPNNQYYSEIANVL